jgi:hypothetical protein
MLMADTKRTDPVTLAADSNIECRAFLGVSKIDHKFVTLRIRALRRRTLKIVWSISHNGRLWNGRAKRPFIRKRDLVVDNE